MAVEMPFTEFKEVFFYCESDQRFYHKIILKYKHFLFEYYIYL